MHSTRTLAAVLAQARGAVTVDPVYLGEPGPGEVLLRMQACGVCHSDLFVAGLAQLPVAPITLGHEGIGTVEAVGEGVTADVNSGAHTWAPGDRAGVTFLGTTCGSCEWCNSGRERFCPKQTNFGYTLQGSLAQFAIVPARALVRIPAALAATDAAPLCCAGWTAYGALREAALAPGQSVALFGFGGLGHLALQIARRQGLRVAVVDVSEAKLEQARAGGAEITARAEEAGRRLQKEAGGVNAAIVLTASPAAIQQAFRSLRRNGTLVLVGLAASGYELPLVDTVLKGVTVRGSFLGTRQDLAEVFELACAGAIQAHVETHELGETPAVLESLRRGEIAGRAVIAF
jgi:propanol-preferring alcohol dehydrogenase